MICNRSRTKRNILKSCLCLFFVLCIPIFMASCSSDETNENGRALPDDELVIAIGGEPDNGFDPCRDWALYGTPVFQSTLLETDFEMGFINDLAESHSVSEDGLVWTYTIREDAKFSDETPVTASDVAFTYMQAKQTSGEHDLRTLSEAITLDDTTVEFRLTEPNSAFEDLTAVLGIVSEINYSDSYGENPIGSGPYQMVEWKRGEQLIIEANPHYYREQPYFKKITLLFSDEDQTFTYLKAGQVDIAKASPVQSMETVDGYALNSYKTLDSRGISFPYSAEALNENGEVVGNNVTSDIAIRKAINYGIDRDALVEGVLNGRGTPTISDSFGMPWYNEEVSSSGNIEEEMFAGKDKDTFINELLAEAGWELNNDGVLEKDGQKAEFTLLYSAGDSARQGIALNVAQQISQYGIKINVEGKSWDDIYKQQDRDAVLFGYGSRTPAEIFSIYSKDGSSNAGLYTNEKVDEYISKALQSTDRAEAIAFWKNAQWDGEDGFSILGDNAWCWVVTINHNYFVRDGLDIDPQKTHSHDHGFQILSSVSSWKWEQ